MSPLQMGYCLLLYAERACAFPFQTGALARRRHSPEGVTKHQALSRGQPLTFPPSARGPRATQDPITARPRPR